MKMTKPIGNQKGLALITTMVLLVLGFAVVAILLRLTTRQTQMAGLEQGYTSALDAAKAGTDMFITYAQNCVTNNHNTGNSCGGLPAAFGTSSVKDKCLTIKLNNPTFDSSGQGFNWTTLNANAWATAGCTATLQQATDNNPTDNPDITLNWEHYTISVKIIDTYQLGHTASGTPCSNGCFYYTAVARAQADNSPEHVDVQFIYRYPIP